MTYDHALSARLGQTTQVESTSIRMFSGAEIPEAAWAGQMIYRTDTQGLQVYNGEAWEDVVTGSVGLLTYVGPDQPVTGNEGDLWYDSDDGNKLYRHDGVTWISLAIGPGGIADGAVTAPKILPGAVRAESFEANMVLSNRIDIGGVDTMGLNPDALEPNLLPELLTANPSAGAITEGIWWPQISGGSTWSQSATEFPLETDDPLFIRLHTGTFPGYKITNTGAAISGSTTAFLLMDTVITVEPNTEYRLTTGSAFPGSTAPSSAVVADEHVNAVKTYVSTSSTFPVGGVAAWASNSPDLNPTPQFVQWHNGILKTATGQTQLYVRYRIDFHYLAANGSAWLIDPTLRKVVTDKTLEAPSSSQAVTVASTIPTATNTNWNVQASWASGTPTTTGSLYTVGAGAFSPAALACPARYQRPDQGSFMASRGVQVTSRSSAAATATLSACTPTVSIPVIAATGANIYHYVDIGFKHVSIATNYAVEMYLFDAADAQIGSAITVRSGSASFWGVNSLTENLFTFRVDAGDTGDIPPEAVKVAFRVVATTSAGVAATDYSFGLHSVRFFSLTDVNPNYGQAVPQHITQDIQGIRSFNERGEVQFNLPTDSSATPFFKGEAELGGLRVLGGATFESSQNEIAKDSILWLSDGIKSPTGVPTLVQEYEQYTLGRTPPDGQFPGFSTKPTLNPAQITGMVWKSEWNEFWIMENRGGGSALWRYSSGGTCKWVGLQSGWQNAQPYEDTRTTPGVNDSLYAGEFGGIHWAVVYTGSARIFNKLPAGTVPDNVEPCYTWNQSNNKLYVWYPHADGSGRNVYKRLGVNNTPNGDMTVEETVVAASGTSRTSFNVGLAGAVALGSNLYTANRDTTSTDVYAFASGSGGSLISGNRFPLAAAPRGFTHDGTTFWQVDTSGKLTRYSTWTWSETNHKLYAGLTWYDSDAAGTGTHETDLTTLTSITLKKRISGIRVSLPQVPDKGGTDDPDKWRLYAAKGTSFAMPGSRTSMWLQAAGGSPSAGTSYTIPANGLITSGTNPPATNNFPGAGAGQIRSTAVDGSSNPTIDIRGNGIYVLGHTSTKTGRMATWTMSGGTSISTGTYVPDPGGYTNVVGEYTANDGWVGISYSGSGVFTCTEKGLYEFESGFNFASGTANTRRWVLAWVNESTYDDTTCLRHRAEACLSGNHQAILRFDVKLNVGDTVRVGWRQDSGASLSATATQGFKIGGTMWSRYMQIIRKA